MGRLRLLAAVATLLATAPALAGTLTISTAATSGVTLVDGSYVCDGAAPCNLDVATLASALAVGGVSVAASGVGADIVVANAISWASGSRLTLSAAQDIELNASITATNGGAVTLRADARCGSVGGIVPGAGTISADTLAYSHDDVDLTATVISGSLSSFKLVDTTGELSSLPSTGAFALGCDMIDPGGYTPVPAFSGVLDGLGHAVIDLLVPAGSGLFTTLSGAVVRNLILVRPGVTLMGGTNVGALAGSAVASTTIADVAVLAATVNGGPGSNNVGGLVGTLSASTIDRVYVSGTVAGAAQVGGVAGRTTSTGSVLTLDLVPASLTNAMSKAAVSGGTVVGGLVGQSAGTCSLTRSWSAGAVTGTAQVGGAVGEAAALSTTSTGLYWDTQASGVANSAAGTGLTATEMRTQGSFSGFDFAGTWAIRGGVSRPFLRSMQALLDVSVAVSSNSPTVATQSASFNAVVTPATGYELPATGSVRFLDGTAAVGSGGLTAGVASVSTTTLSLGAHTVRAIYDGTPYHIENDGSVSHTVNAASSQTALTAQDGPIVATVSPVAPATGTPTGSITFNVDGADRAPVTLVGPTATLDPSTLGAGSHTIIATFASDDGRFGPSTSPSIEVTVVGPTVTTITQSAIATALGEAFDLTATVSSTDGSPTGSVRFIADGAQQLAEVTLSGGSATASVASLSGGTHIIVAQFLPATTDFTASLSAQIAHDVAKANSSTNLTVADIHDGIVMVSVEVLRPADTLPIPTGDVVVSIDDVEVGDPALVDGIASFTSEQLTRGSHTLSARYEGDVNYNGSASSQLELSVDLEGFRLAANPRRAVTFAGGSVPFTLTLTPEAETFAEQVTFVCESLPPGGSCTFSPAITDVPSVGTLVGLLVNTQRPILAGGLTAPRVPPLGWALLALVGGGMVASIWVRRLRLAWGAVVVVMACTESPAPVEPREGTPVGTYTVTVRALGETVSRVTEVEVEVR